MTHSQAIAAVGPMEQAKILVVEDDPDIRKILELYLGEMGFRVKMADGARRAVGHLHAEALLAEVELQDLPDVRIVLDHQDLGLLHRADGGNGLGMGHVGLASLDPGVPSLAVRAPGCVSGDAKGVPAGSRAAPRRALLARRTEKSSPCAAHRGRGRLSRGGVRGEARSTSASCDCRG